mmetsp:Transcript_50248/g.108193  ORF Transcript_50248/g.108193 Transcript_50248/m.108193 type:complete len:687 (+) Transcript_50248:512-2572(+)
MFPMPQQQRGRSPGRKVPRAADVPSSRQIRKYARLFHRTDLDGDGFATQDEYMTIFSRSGLPPQTLSQICQLVGADYGARLTFGQFVGAMHLINSVMSGATLPPQLSPQLLNFIGILGSADAPPVANLASRGSSRSASATRSATPVASSSPSPPTSRAPSRGRDRDVPSARDLRKYARLFQRLDVHQTGRIPIQTMQEMSLKSGLGQDALGHVFRLCVDPEMGGFVDYPGLVGIMHMIRRLRSPQQPQLPLNALAEDLAEYLKDLRARAPNPMRLSRRGNSRSASTSRSQSRMESRGPHRDLPNARDCRKYARLFMRLANDGSTVTLDDAYQLLARSGLSQQETTQIVQLAADGNSVLNWQSFIALMHLVRASRAGTPYQAITPDLRQFLEQFYRTPDDLAREGRSRSASQTPSPTPTPGLMSFSKEDGLPQFGTWESPPVVEADPFGLAEPSKKYTYEGGYYGDAQECYRARLAEILTYRLGELAARGNSRTSPEANRKPPNTGNPFASAPPNLAPFGSNSSSVGLFVGSKLQEEQHRQRILAQQGHRPKAEPAQKNKYCTALRTLQPAFAVPGHPEHVGEPPSDRAKLYGPQTLLSTPLLGSGPSHCATESANIRRRIAGLSGSTLHSQVKAFEQAQRQPAPSQLYRPPGRAPGGNPYRSQNLPANTSNLFGQSVGSWQGSEVF